MTRLIFRPSLITLTIVSALAASTSAQAQLKTVREWRFFDYVWDSEDQRELAVNQGVYNYTNIIPFDFQKTSDGRILITTPKITKDNPASLSVVSDEEGPGGPLLKPYPSWDLHTAENCEGIISVSRIFIDKCDRIWVVDSGKIGDEQVCPAQILSFDSTTDEISNRVQIPDDVSHNSADSSKGRLEIQFVETNGDSCSETWVYIGDPEGYGLVMWDGEDIWRLENDEVYAPASDATTYSVAGENVTLEIGTSVAVIPPSGFVDEDYLFLKPKSSFSDYAVKVEDLHKSKDGRELTYYKGNITLPSQELVRVFSDSGVMLGALASSLVIACYYFGNPLALDYVGQPLEDDEALQFTSAGKIIGTDGGAFEDEEYWSLTNRYQKFILGTMNFNESNFRILSVYIADLVNGTVCEPTSHTAETIEDKFFFEYKNATSSESASSRSLLTQFLDLMRLPLRFLG